MATVSLARYLFTRLHQIGVRSMFGVPGDFMLKALDHLKPSGLRWIGNCNELNAGYAADGYARKKGIGALFTTMGVGELSAINAIMGAYSEHSPVVHIVGTAARRLQNSGALVHHTLGDGNFRIFKEMYERVTVAQANLIDSKTAANQVDEVLSQCVSKSKPVYIELPSDMTPVLVSADQLENPLTLFSQSNNTDEERNAMDVVLQRIYSANKPLILVDGLSDRYDIRDELDQLVRLTGIPTMCLPFGKGVIDERLSNFHGVHVGKFGSLDHSAYTDSADLVLLFGPLLSDNNTCGFTTVPKPHITIAFQQDSVDIGSPAGTKSSSLGIKSALQALLKRLDSSRMQKMQGSLQPYNPPTGLPSPTSSDPITQSLFYPLLSKYIQPNDTILLANGTPLPGARDIFLPPDTQIIQGSIFLSVGHMLPAAVGAGLARQDSDGTSIQGGDISSPGRIILLEGDGSFQASAQELSTAIRYKVPLTIFLINNQGYTYERLIHGIDADYNDVAAWNYLEAPRMFGSPPPGAVDYPVRTWRVQTWSELVGALDSREFRQDSERGLMMIEVIMGKDDVPGKLTEVLRGAGEALEKQ